MLRIASFSVRPHLHSLEEKIAALIQKKRKLLNSVVKEDGPGLLKSFTREELIEQVDMPADTKLIN
jgi:hypothetical protein